MSDDARALINDHFGIDVSVSEDHLNETIVSMLSHRSCRRYRPEPVPPGLLDLLLACAQSAPTKSNLQQYSILVIADPERRRRVAALIPNLTWLDQASELLVFLGDVRRIRRLAEIHRHDYANNNADTFMNAVVDAALAMQAFITAAESAGLGACPISLVRNQIDAFSELVELPDGVFPIAGLSLGWPADVGRRSLRLPPAVAVHRDRYDDSNLEAEIAAYDDRAHARHPIAADSQRHTDRYGVSDRCVWSENVSRQLSVPERPGFADYLKRRGIELS